jgi:kinesin family protein 1
MSTSQTEESNDNPWGQLVPGTTMTTNSISTPANVELDMDIPPHIDETSEASTEPLSARLYNQKTAESILEQQHLTKQLRALAQELKRTRSQAAVSRALDNSAVEDANWSARELRLVQESVARWKRLRTYKMAEEILVGAVNIREANVIA